VSGIESSSAIDSKNQQGVRKQAQSWFTITWGVQ
jgi:hypothetical protein